MGVVRHPGQHGEHRSAAEDHLVRGDQRGGWQSRRLSWRHRIDARAPLAAVGRRRWPRLRSTTERSTRSKGGPGAHDHRGLRLLRGRRRDGQVDAGARPRGVARAARLPPAADLRAGRHPGRQGDAPHRARPGHRRAVPPHRGPAVRRRQGRARRLRRDAGARARPGRDHRPLRRLAAGLPGSRPRPRPGERRARRALGDPRPAAPPDRRARPRPGARTEPVRRTRPDRGGVARLLRPRTHGVPDARGRRPRPLPRGRREPAGRRDRRVVLTRLEPLLVGATR